jgi:hypothetical protein
VAPSWTRAGYKGQLDNAIKKACNLEVDADNLDQPGLQQAMGDNLDQPESQNTMVIVESDSQESLVIVGNLDQPGSQDTLGSQESEINALLNLQLAYSDEYMSGVGEEEEEEKIVLLTSDDVHDKSFDSK